MENNISKLFGSQSTIKLLSFLSQKKVPSSGREIARQAHLSPQTVHQTLQKLAKMGLIRVEKIGSAIVYQLNSEHLLIQKCLFPMLEVAHSWLEMVGNYYMSSLKVKPLSILVFGSHARNKATAKSDLDLLFLYKDKDFDLQQLSEINQFSSKVFEMCGHQPVPILAKITDFKQQAKSGEGLMRTIVREGRTVAGALISEVLTNDAN
ncbi:MAG: hypothetical protein A3H42_01475 [Deltaproteobacteria bacterium RIFCSPLOWO2_02_FULL_46_8]|nr:MAG: hypothetical protein A3H42_01475 [Deltaproteobacteria bacterium RIFCSPLOWO2_02_FULL_46_8]